MVIAKMSFIKDKLKLQEYHNYASFKGGLFLSTECIYSHTKTLWECKEGHRWEARFANIKKGNWCPYCSGKMKLTIEQLQEYAKKKNGKLISLEYKNSHTDLIWECESGHQFKAKWNNIQPRNCWCPECSKFKTEKLCKKLLEEKLNLKFEKKRFYIDKNKYYEFDGYNEQDKIAFEYHGIQHYEFPNYWHSTKKEFLDNQKRDDLKEQFAAENNIQLIIIPYTQENNLEVFINRISKKEN